VTNPDDLKSVLEEMRRDWNERAVENARYYVSTGVRTWEDFDASGKGSFDEIVRPYLPVLLRGRSPRECRVAEIGCGLGRMTAWFAREFGEVHAIDISTEMLAKAGERLSGFNNVVLHASSGMDLAPLPDGYFDLAFSYIVFQHIPSREVIRNYILEAGRILKPGGAFHFQLNGYLSPDAYPREKDTWEGESFSFSEAVDMLRAAGLAPFNAVGAGTQYFLLSARRISSESQPLSSFILPGQAWPNGQLLDGWFRDIPGDCRPIGPLNRAVLGVPSIAAEESDDLRLFVALSCGAASPYPTATVALDGRDIGAVRMQGAGGYYCEFLVPSAVARASSTIVTLSFNPAFVPVSIRSLGLYAPSRHTAQSESIFWIANLEQECARLDRELARSAKRIAELLVWAHSLDGDVEKARSNFAQLRTEFEERTAWALSLRDEVKAARNGWSRSNQQLMQYEQDLNQISAKLRSAQENPWPLVESKIKRTLWSLLKRVSLQA
jgi:SAM-dependent methyltransferase